MSDSQAPSTSATQAGSRPLEVRLLGPFEVALAGRTVSIGSPKQRAVLALLALQAGRVVTSETLCDLVWDKDPPASASATLQSLISRLRATLAGTSGGPAEAGREVLRTREPGWVLDADATAIDALRFQELTARARRRIGRGEPAAAVADLTEATALWRGAALADVVDAGYLAPYATRLNEARLDAIEDLAEAMLATGRPSDALAHLEAHVDDNPLRERAWGLLMVALYRLGRQAAALRVFQQARAILAEELGLEPSPELAEIEQGILRHDPALAGPAGAAGSVGPPRRTPPQSAPRPLAPEPAGSPTTPSVEKPAEGVQAAQAGHGVQATQAHQGVQATQAGEFADYSVVVVEDHDFQRRTVVQLLRGLGVGTVADAASGDEALRVLQASPSPDVIICDIDMPGMDGVEFVTRVAESGLACSIVIASGLESNVLRAVEAIGESHGLHVLAALPKPLTARRLAEVLRQYTRLNRRRAEHGDRSAFSSEELLDSLEGGEMRAQFEPRIDLTTGAFSSAETGRHWHGPDGAPILSSDFAPALAGERLLVAFVDRLVAESSALLDEAARAGLDVNAPIRVGLDVSLLLADVSLADRLSQMVQDHRQDPRRLVCQLDDGALARAPSTALAALTRLRVKGFGLSMNHSGVGPSWTHHLGRVPLSELRLDRPLVTAATSEPKRFQMLEAALASARDMGLPVVADGCDSQADLDMLLALGCSEAQGRWVAEPMEAADVVAWAIGGYRPDEPGVPS